MTYLSDLKKLYTYIITFFKEFFNRLLATSNEILDLIFCEKYTNGYVIDNYQQIIIARSLTIFP